MKICRVFTGADNRTHIEELPKSSLPGANSIQTAAGVFFREYPANHFMDWHPAPRRQWVVLMKGTAEIGLEDGSSFRFEPGDAFLVEDTTGRGHTTRIGSEPLVWIVVPLTN
jgi:hypothetical protein